MSLFIKKWFYDNFQKILENETFKDKQLLKTFLSTKKPNYETTLKFLEIHNNYFWNFDYNDVFDWRYINWYENINWNSNFSNDFSSESVFRRLNRRGLEWIFKILIFLILSLIIITLLYLLIL